MAHTLNAELPPPVIYSGNDKALFGLTGETVSKIKRLYDILTNELNE